MLLRLDRARLSMGTSGWVSTPVAWSASPLGVQHGAGLECTQQDRRSSRPETRRRQARHVTWSGAGCPREPPPADSGQARLVIPPQNPQTHVRLERAPAASRGVHSTPSWVSHHRPACLVGDYWVPAYGVPVSSAHPAQPVSQAAG